MNTIDKTAARLEAVEVSDLFSVTREDLLTGREYVARVSSRRVLSVQRRADGQTIVRDTLDGTPTWTALDTVTSAMTFARQIAEYERKS